MYSTVTTVAAALVMATVCWAADMLDGQYRRAACCCCWQATHSR